MSASDIIHMSPAANSQPVQPDPVSIDDRSPVTPELNQIAMIVLMHPEAFGDQTQKDALHVLSLRFEPEEERLITSDQLVHLSFAGLRIAQLAASADKKQPGALEFLNEDPMTPLVCDMLAALIAGEDDAVERALGGLRHYAQQMAKSGLTNYGAKATEYRFYQQAKSILRASKQGVA